MRSNTHGAFDCHRAYLLYMMDDGDKTDAYDLTKNIEVSHKYPLSSSNTIIFP